MPFGKGIAEFTQALIDGGIRSERYRARATALTETLRAHSVAQQEALIQNPAVESKEWVHTGAYRNTPRENHVAMNGVIVPKDEPFVLEGADGVTYYPMYPRDPSLPPGESVNCHCIHRGVVNDDILGLPLEERKRLQQEAIDAMDDEWEKELDAKNKAKAGITFLKTKFILTETGYVVRKMSRPSIRAMKRKLFIFRKWVDSGKFTLEDVRTAYESWRGHMRRGDSYHAIARVDEYFKRLFGFHPNDKIKYRRLSLCI